MRKSGSYSDYPPPNKPTRNDSYHRYTPPSPVYQQDRRYGPMTGMGGSDGPSNHEDAVNIIVPDELVCRLIGRNGESVKNVMTRTKTHINFY
jgi:hypothetical protein